MLATLHRIAAALDVPVSAMHEPVQHNAVSPRPEIQPSELDELEARLKRLSAPLCARIMAALRR